MSAKKATKRRQRLRWRVVAFIAASGTAVGVWMLTRDFGQAISSGVVLLGALAPPTR